MIKETRYMFVDRPYYHIGVAQHINGGNIDITIRLAENDDFVIELSQQQVATLVKQLARYVGLNVVDRKLSDY